MLQRATPFALALLALAPAASAQLSFDLILPDRFDVRGYDPYAPYSVDFGVLVNTGTVPIHASDWSGMALHFGYSDEFLDWFEMRPKVDGWSVLMPGEAVGAWHPVYNALLQPGETLAYSGKQVLDVRLDGADGLKPDITFALEFEGQLVRADLHPTILDQSPAPIALGTAIRWSSQGVVPSFTESTAGCPLLAWDMPLGAAGAGGIESGNTARHSDLPVLGNDRFILRYPSFPPAEVGNPWFLLIANAGPPISALGCEVGAVAAPFDFGLVPPVHPEETLAHPGILWIPIPYDPALAGLELGLQWGVFSPNAVNGLVACSPGVTVHLRDLGL